MKKTTKIIIIAVAFILLSAVVLSFWYFGYLRQGGNDERAGSWSGQTTEKDDKMTIEEYGQYVINNMVKDSDVDGLPDDQEKKLGTDPKKVDTDGDQIPDYTELQAGTDPLAANSLEEAERILNPEIDEKADADGDDPSGR